ncbi:MAG TPA: ComEC/Rec2 family competence protein [Lachnospiraceae bacterium]|nr:ComEC/Rec2 family competence protein [Lachnospiraceae bacterium]
MKKHNLLAILILYIILLTSCSNATPENSIATNNEVNGGMAVHFLDVGQGNAVLVENDGLYMLIDGGDQEYSSFVVSYLKKAGVKKLEYIITSHYDADHLNGIVGALNIFDVGLILDPDYKTDTRVFDSYTKLVAAGIDEVHPKQGDTYELGDATFTVVSPVDYNYSDGNDDSVGIRILHGKDSFLICGDAGKESEEDILQSGIPLESTVYMVNHHGSNTSSTDSFLESIDPTYAVISCGLDNSYGHPNKEIMDKIKERDITFFRTDKQGTIIAYSSGKGITWNVDPSTDYSSGEQNVKADSSESNGKEGESTSNPYSIDSKTTIYIINTNTNKFHRPDCSSVTDMKPENRLETDTSRDELIKEGYEACSRCKP